MERSRLLLLTPCAYALFLSLSSSALSTCFLLLHPAFTMNFRKVHTTRQLYHVFPQPFGKALTLSSVHPDHEAVSASYVAAQRGCPDANLFIVAQPDEQKRRTCVFIPLTVLVLSRVLDIWLFNPAATNCYILFCLLYQTHLILSFGWTVYWRSRQPLTYYYLLSWH